MSFISLFSQLLLYYIHFNLKLIYPNWCVLLFCICIILLCYTLSRARNRIHICYTWTISHIFALNYFNLYIYNYSLHILSFFCFICFVSSSVVFSLLFSPSPSYSLATNIYFFILLLLFFLLNNFLFYFIRYFSSKFLSLSYLPCPHLSSTFLTFSLLLFFPPSIHIALPLLFCFSSSFFSSTIFPFWISASTISSNVLFVNSSVYFTSCLLLIFSTCFLVQYKEILFLCYTFLNMLLYVNFYLFSVLLQSLILYL